MKARAVRFQAPGAVEITDVDLPELADGQVLVRTIFSGISAGTEMLAYRGEIDPSLPLDETLGALSGTFSYPFSYGYSCVGTVERSRSDVAEGSLIFAFNPHQDLFVIDAAETIDLEGVDPRVATLLPFLETAVQVCLDAGARYRETVVVVGLGALGILVAVLLGRVGADVIASEPQAWRRQVASSFGVRAVEAAALASTVEEATGGRGADLVIEVSGSPDALGPTLELLAHEGTAIVGSWYGTKPVPLPLGGDFHRRRLSIRSTQVSTIPGSLTPRWDRERRRSVARSLLHELPVKLLATHEYPFDQASEAFAAVERGEEGLIQAALSYR